MKNNPWIMEGASALVVPEAVENPQDPAMELYTMSWTSLVPVLVNAVQELKHQQDAKGTKIAALEVDNTKLKAASDELVDLKAERETCRRFGGFRESDCPIREWRCCPRGLFYTRIRGYHAAGRLLIAGDSNGSIIARSLFRGEFTRVLIAKAFILSAGKDVTISSPVSP